MEETDALIDYLLKNILESGWLSVHTKNGVQL